MFVGFFHLRSAGAITFMQVVYNSLLNAYANCQMPDKAREVFEKIEVEGLQRDVVCALIILIITSTLPVAPVESNYADCEARFCAYCLYIIAGNFPVSEPSLCTHYMQQVF